MVVGKNHCCASAALIVSLTVAVAVRARVGVGGRTGVSVGMVVSVAVGMVVSVAVGMVVSVAVGGGGGLTGVSVGTVVSIEVTVGVSVAVRLGTGVGPTRVFEDVPAHPWSHTMDALLFTVLPPQMLYVLRAKATQERVPASTVPSVQVSSSGLPGR